MDTVLDVQEVQQQLDRAARAAKDGPADIRAGRFAHGNVPAVTSVPGKADGHAKRQFGEIRGRSPDERSDIRDHCPRISLRSWRATDYARPLLQRNRQP